LLEVLFFEILPPFSQGNNGLDAAGSYIDAILWRDICVSSTQLKRPIKDKMSHSPPWELW
jgi:hypothetical protein